MEKLYTCREVANLFRVKVGTVYAWIKNGKIKATVIGAAYRVKESEIKRIMEG